MTIKCPKCGMKTYWTPQTNRVRVMCVNREITGLRRGAFGPVQQLGAQIYASSDRSSVWVEGYPVDGPPRLPGWYCGARFVVKAA